MPKPAAPSRKSAKNHDRGGDERGLGQHAEHPGRNTERIVDTPEIECPHGQGEGEDHRHRARPGGGPAATDHQDEHEHDGRHRECGVHAMPQPPATAVAAGRGRSSVSVVHPAARIEPS